MLKFAIEASDSYVLVVPVEDFDFFPYWMWCATPHLPKTEILAVVSKMRFLPKLYVAVILLYWYLLVLPSVPGVLVLASTTENNYFFSADDLDEGKIKLKIFSNSVYPCTW